MRVDGAGENRSLLAPRCAPHESEPSRFSRTITLAAATDQGSESAADHNSRRLVIESSRFDHGPRRASIVITARNYGRFLPEAIESALRQTVRCEVVYSDDYSQDDSVAIARRYEHLGVIVLESSRHLGVCAARNRGAAASTADYLIHLDGDDILPPDFVERHFDSMAPGVPFVYGPAQAFGDGRVELVTDSINIHVWCSLAMCDVVEHVP